MSRKPALSVEMTRKNFVNGDLPATETLSKIDKTNNRKDSIQHMSLYVPISTWRALQLRKIDERRDVNAIINTAIQRYLESGSGL